MSKDTSKILPRLALLITMTRPKFLVASIAPVLVGSALGLAAAGTFEIHLFILAMLSMMALHCGANITNDYYDHLSKNDWVNENPTPFSGGRRFIQNSIVSPKATLLAALFYLVIGSAIGLLIVVITQSLIILVIGIIGLLGGFFYTANPIRLGYRGVGEIVITFLFGILPVYGSYYLQTKMLDTTPLLPALIVGILIFLVIFINEFPDLAADKKVNKRTLVVLFGISKSVWIYRSALIASFAIAIIMLFQKFLLIIGASYLVIFPLAVVTFKAANKTDLAQPGKYKANKLTILTHHIGSFALTVGAVISAFT